MKADGEYSFGYSQEEIDALDYFYFLESEHDNTQNTTRNSEEPESAKIEF